MANMKKITLDTQSGMTVYCIIRRESDGYLLNDADGAFASGPADPYVSMAEHGVIKGRYELSESRAAWNDGQYTSAIYRQSGASPSPASDTIIGTGAMYVKGDSEVVLDESVATRLATSAYTAPDNAGISAIKAKTDTNLDAAVSSRATAGDIASAFGTGVLQSQITLSGDAIETYRGDTKPLTFSLGSAWNLTGKKAYLCVKSDPAADNSTAIINRELTVTDAVNGVCSITPTSGETATVGRYYAEIEVRNTDDTSPMTAMRFDLIIRQDVRQ